MPTINGTTQADSLVGTAGEDTLSGYEGNDTLVGAGGNDRLITGDGADSVRAGDGDDEVNGYMVDAATGRFSFFPSTGRKTIYGEAGNDFLVGGSDADLLDGGAGNDSLHGLEGADTLLGGEGGDALYGEEGDDRLEGQAGNDSLQGQAGNDTLLGGAGDDELQPGDGRDQADGGDGNDRVNGYLRGTSDGAYGYWVVTGAKTLSGGAGDDVVVGGSGDDVLSGDAGQDVLHGLAGNDLLRGGEGDDRLGGEDGNDTLDGGSGIDTLDGGLGNDTYILSGLQFSLRDDGGTDTAQVQVSHVKLPSTIENVVYAPGMQALPYWVDALLPDEAAGLQFRTLMGTQQVVNYCFPAALPPYDTNAAHGLGYTPFTTAQITRAEAALRYIETVTGLRFVRTNEPNAPRTIAFANNQQTGSAGYAFYPNDSATGSDLFLNKDSPGNFTLAEGERAAQTLIHELGHALGLEHPFQKSDTSGHASDPPFLPAAEDTTAWTVMSYTDGPQAPTMQFSALDLAALQYLYGPGANRMGADTYRLDALVPHFIWDGGGQDRIDASGLSEPVTMFLSPGQWGYVGAARASLITAPGQVTVNFGTVIEEALGTRLDDRIVGNDADNRLMGGAGRDTLTGSAGQDTLEGGDGEDTATFSGVFTGYYYERDAASGALRVTALKGNEGTDTLLSVERAAFADRTVSTAALGGAAAGAGASTTVPELYHFFVVAFAGAPGATYMGQLMEAYNFFSQQPRKPGDPSAVQQIVEIFTTKPQFTSVYPQTLSPRDMATQLVNRVVKTSATEAAKAEAMSQIEAALNPPTGWSRGQMLYTVFGNLANKPLTDPVWGQTALQFQKQLAVARYLTETLAYESTDVAKLQAVLADVTPQTDVSTPLLIAQIIGAALPGG